jgi:hypothetical protein
MFSQPPHKVRKATGAVEIANLKGYAIGVK